MEIEVVEKDGGDLLVNAKFAEILALNGISRAADLWNLKSEPVKAKLKERGTFRVFLEAGDGAAPVEAYLKRFKPLPLKEYFKSFVSFKPLFRDGAFHEWEAMLEFHGRNLPTADPMACARTAKGTCILSQGIRNYSRLSDIFANFAKSDYRRRRELVVRVAEIAGRMHSANLAHQDFYLVHLFLVESEDKIYVIDLQRLINHGKLSSRWRTKDLAQLHFSAIGMVRRTDIMRFWKKYADICGNDFSRDRKQIHAIVAKSARIYSRMTGRH